MRGVGSGSGSGGGSDSDGDSDGEEAEVAENGAGSTFRLAPELFPDFFSTPLPLPLPLADEEGGEGGDDEAAGTENAADGRLGAYLGGGTRTLIGTCAFSFAIRERESSISFLLAASLSLASRASSFCRPTSAAVITPDPIPFRVIVPEGADKEEEVEEDNEVLRCC